MGCRPRRKDGAGHAFVQGYATRGPTTGAGRAPCPRGVGRCGARLVGLGLPRRVAARHVELRARLVPSLQLRVRHSHPLVRQVRLRPGASVAGPQRRRRSRRSGAPRGGERRGSDGGCGVSGLRGSCAPATDAAAPAEAQCLERQRHHLLRAPLLDRQARLRVRRRPVRGITSLLSCQRAPRPGQFGRRREKAAVVGGGGDVCHLRQALAG